MVKKISLHATYLDQSTQCCVYVIAVHSCGLNGKCLILERHVTCDPLILRISYTILPFTYYETGHSLAAHGNPLKLEVFWLINI